jgi:hypothetical protein
VAVVILACRVQLAIPREDKWYQVRYIYQGPQIILSMDCDAFGLTADVSGIKVPGNPLTLGPAFDDDLDLEVDDT